MRLWHVLHNRLLSLFLRDRRDARGTALVDNTVRDILYAFRTASGARRWSPSPSCRRCRSGWGWSPWSSHFSTWRSSASIRCRSVHEMFAVEKPRGRRRRAGAFHDRGIRRAPSIETSVFTGVYAERPEIDTRIDGRMMSGYARHRQLSSRCWASTAVMGRRLTPADDERFAGRPVMVLSHRGWDRLFARDPNVSGPDACSSTGSRTRSSA